MHAKDIEIGAGITVHKSNNRLTPFCGSVFGNIKIATVVLFAPALTFVCPGFISILKMTLRTSK